MHRPAAREVAQVSQLFPVASLPLRRLEKPENQISLEQKLAQLQQLERPVQVAQQMAQAQDL
jgi:hypothetical protein